MLSRKEELRAHTHEEEQEETEEDEEEVTRRLQPGYRFPATGLTLPCFRPVNWELSHQTGCLYDPANLTARYKEFSLHKVRIFGGNKLANERLANRW